MPVMTDGQRVAMSEIAIVLRDTFQATTDLNFDALAESIVNRLDLAAVAYMNQRRLAFDEAMDAILDYDGIIKRNLHETIARLTFELAECNRMRARTIKSVEVVAGS